MAEIIETISDKEIVKLMVGVLEKIKERAQKSFSDKLYMLCIWR